MFNALKSGGVLVTYCAKGQFKRNLKAVGFKVEAIPGPPGKREMTRAFKF
jgi:tRNA U34 5-methylaminomethyl-2-thiouridine-forming methyltransferase MnmC